MARNLYSNSLNGAFVIWVVILGGIEGHPPPHRRFEDQRFVERDRPTPEATSSSRNEPRLPEPRIRESLSVEYEPRVKLSAVGTRGNPGSDGKIVFPSDLPYIGPNGYTPPSAADICGNTTFCENPPNYPSDFIRNAIESREDLKHLATVDTVPDIGQRIDSDDGETLCTFRDTVIYPRTAQDEEKKWHYIVNVGNFSQGVRVEECMTANTACKDIGFSDGWKTSCKQKYVRRALAAVLPNGIDERQFPFPASCCCHVKFTGDPAARIGARFGSRTNPRSPARPGKTASSRSGEIGDE